MVIICTRKMYGNYAVVLRSVITCSVIRCAMRGCWRIALCLGELACAIHMDFVLIVSLYPGVASIPF